MRNFTSTTLYRLAVATRTGNPGLSCALLRKSNELRGGSHA